MNDSAMLETFLSYFQILENGDSPALQFIGKWGYIIYEKFGWYQTSIHLLLSATIPMYIAAHASLKQPPSAAKSLKDEEAENEDDELEVKVQMEGLTPSDAIFFPLTASIALTGFYFFIKWMGDAKLLNKILTYYFSATGLFAIANLVSNALDLIVAFVFPDRWSNGEDIHTINPDNSRQVTARFVDIVGYVDHETATTKSNPFPGYLSAVPFPSKVNKFLWSTRALFKKHWILRFVLHGVVNHKQSIHLNNILGFTAGCAAIFVYSFVKNYWWIQNLMGVGLVYGSMQLMSPTTFSTGSLVLMSLFFYDIVMVFYTPMMISVATSLDVPMKLTFPGPKGTSSMLGLGDIVVPGIMLALALRFDLYLHYFYKQMIGHGTTPTTNGDSSQSSEDSSSDGSTAQSGAHSSQSDEEYYEKLFADAPQPKKTPAPTMMKERYIDATGLWGERFWTRKGPEEVSHFAEAARFSKVYFTAAMIGYIIGMLVTLYVCQLFKHGQPALLYLVPGVLIALWGTAYFRGELKLMYEYTEDGVWEWDAQALGKTKTKKVKKEEEAEKKTASEATHAQHVFLLSLTDPKPDPSKQKSK